MSAVRNRAVRHPVLDVADLRVAFDAGRTTTEVVSGISFTVDPGECLALVGESGSGKSVTARTVIGLTGRGGQVSATALRLGGRDALGFSRNNWRDARGKDVGFVLQDALVSLDPLRTVAEEVGEALRIHKSVPRNEIGARVAELLTSVGIPDPATRARQYPHELSGGLRQRALIAAAIAANPPLLIADEPTTALDVTIQAQILELLHGLVQQGTALLLISHDLAVVAQLADRIAVMQAGEIVETGSTREVLESPQHPYTRRLLAAVPSAHRRGERLSAAPARVSSGHRPTSVAAQLDTDGIVLDATGIVRSFRTPGGGTRRAVNNVSFTLERGRSLGIVGESGSGKTTLARIALGLLAADAGSVLLEGATWSELPERERRHRRHRIQLISQDPLGSFDPRYTVGQIIDEAVRSLGVPRVERRGRAVQLLDQVGLDADFLRRRPQQMSGGQRQRVAIARALATEPVVLVCDEPVSALDISIQAQVLDLLVELKDRLQVALLFISHDLGVVHHVSDDVLVMKDGRVVESGATADVFAEPGHPYTRALLAALPRLPGQHIFTAGSDSFDRKETL